MAVNLAYETYEEALAGLAEQGLDFAGLDTAAMLETETALAAVSARLLAATLAKRALELVADGLGVSEAVNNAMDAMRKQTQAAMDTNLRVAYGHGRFVRAQESETMDYITFSTMGDAKVRPAHKALDGVTLHKSHPWWLTHSAPLDWRCRCRTYGVDREMVEDLERTISEEPPQEEMKRWKNPLTGETEDVPASISPGWLVDGKSPAVDPKASLDKLLERKLAEIGALKGPDQLELPV